jgi:hypothetical protein
MGVTTVDEFDLDVRLSVNQRARKPARVAYPLRLQDDDYDGGAEGAGPGGEDESNTCYSTCADPECGGEVYGTNGDCENPPPKTNGDCNPDDRPTKTFMTCCVNTCTCPEPNQDDSNTCYSTCSDEECGGGGDSNTCFSTCSDCPTVQAYTCVGDCTNDCMESE